MGTLCIIDHKPRKISQEQLKTLEILANQIIKHLESRKLNTELLKALENIESKHQLILNQAKVAQFQSKMAAIGHLAAGVGHEINNPLTIIKGKLRILEKKILSNVDAEEVKSSFKVVDDSLNRIEKIVKGIKSFTSKDNLSLRTFDAIEVSQGVFELHQELLNENNIQFNYEFENNDSRTCCLEGDPGSLREVILHLISNAKDATKNQSNPWIKARLALSSGEFLITVEDNGIGIADSIKDKVFDPFFTTKEVNEGTGIGLSTCYHIVTEEFLGSLSFVSSEGKGSTFTVRLPTVEEGEKR